MSLTETLRLPIESGFTLASVDPSSTPDAPSKEQAKKAVAGELSDRLFDLHEMIMANADRSVLLVLQGSDASGKSGTIKHVIGGLNPLGVRVAGFVEPDAEEESHHFLWRIEQELPPKGYLGAFDRSHYEDVVVPRVEEEIDADELQSRFDDITEFERRLADDGTTIVKAYLHISYDEQRDRLLRRLRREDKRWKFNEADLETRRKWDLYQAAYAEAIERTHADHAPWFVVPADRKWYRNWAIATLLIENLEKLGLQYPQPDLDLDGMRSRLQPPL